MTVEAVMTMNFAIRTVAVLSAFGNRRLVLLAALPKIGRAQSYPRRPVRIVVGQAAGSGSDILARLIAQWLSERLGQPFVVENRPGAGGNIGAEAVVRAPPDGHTLLLITSTNAINTALYPNLSFNVVRDIAAVGSVTLTPYALVVNPSFSAKTVPEFINYAKANPGKINMASGGNGSVSHVSCRIVQVDGGRQCGACAVSGLDSRAYGCDRRTGAGHVRRDDLVNRAHQIGPDARARELPRQTRSDLLPDVPTIGDFVSGYEVNRLARLWRSGRHAY